jgi:leucyl aminopeptidase
MKTHFHSQPETYKGDMIVLLCNNTEQSIQQIAERYGKNFPTLVHLPSTEDFTGKFSTSAMLYSGQNQCPRILVVGIGEPEKLTIEKLRKIGAHIGKTATGIKISSVGIIVSDEIIHIAKTSTYHTVSPVEVVKSTPADAIRALTEGIRLSAYKYVKYFSDRKKTSNTVQSITYILEDTDFLHTHKKSLQAEAQYAHTTSDAVLIARALAHAPNNELYPEVLAERTQALGKEHGFKVTVLNKSKIKAQKMNGLLAVNQGSVRPPVFIIMEYHGGKSNEAPIVLVGKGITFDTGGISIKPSAGMAEMKMDMHGAATMIATMVAVAKNKLKKNVIALVPSTENMPSGTAQVPGDIITFANGKTVEVDNTDAEGRLILADALLYAQRYKPCAIIDAATLTGAVTVALGHIATGIMSNSRELLEKFQTASAETYELLGELPLYEEYEELIKSDIADIRNVGIHGAGTITAAMFLQHFVGDYPWVHLDIAGTSITKTESAYAPKGGTGVGVRLLTELIRSWQ